MNRKISMPLVITAALVIGLWGALFTLPIAHAESPNPAAPAWTLDEVPAAASAIDGPLTTGGDWSLEPSSFPPNRLTSGDLAAVRSSWDQASDAGRIGALGVSGGAVKALAISASGVVYVGGTFTSAGGDPAISYLARWSSVTGWSKVGNGVNGAVYALAIRQNGATEELYVGGALTQVGGSINCKYAGLWAGSWSCVGSGTNAAVRALAVDAANQVYAGGDFTTAGGVTANGIARWTGSAWQAVAGGVYDFDGNAAGKVYALAVQGSDLFAGGEFGKVGASKRDAAYLARFDGSSWTNVGDTLGLQQVVDSLASNGELLYVASRHTQTGGFHVYRVATTTAHPTWINPEFTALAQSTHCADAISDCDRVYALAAVQNSLFIGGTFLGTSATFTPTLSSSVSGAAYWNGRLNQWSAMSGGVTGAIARMDGAQSLVLDDASLYAGGTFTQAGGVAGAGVARWIQPMADLALVAGIEEDAFVAGNSYTYDMSVTNNGYVSALRAAIQAELPSQVTVTSSTCGDLTAPYECSFGTLAAEARQAAGFTFSVPATLAKGTVLDFGATTESDQYDPEWGNNERTAQRTVSLLSQLALSKTAPATAVAGGEIEYALSLRNDGPSAASGIKLTDTLPVGVDFVSAAGCTTNGEHTIVYCDIGSLSVGQTITRSLRAIVDVVGDVVNVARAGGPDAPEVSKSATTTATGVGGLSISKSDYLTEVGLNEQFAYEVKVRNRNADAVNNVRITDTLPAGVSWLSLPSWPP